MALAAVVVHHHEDSNLANTLAAVDAQQQVPDFKLLVASARPEALGADWLFVQHEVSGSVAETGIDGGIDSQSIALALGTLPTGGALDGELWLWLLASGSIPEVDVTRQLLGKYESTPSAGIIGAKLVDTQNLRVIRSLGITLTRAGQLFTPVSGEFDQAQHDHIDDVLGVQLNGSLLRASSFESVGGLNTKLPIKARALEFGIRLRLAGFRTVVAPTARVAVDQGGGRVASLSAELRAAQAIRFLLLPAPLALLFGLAQPFVALLQTLWFILVKQPERIGPSWAAGFGTFFTVGRLFVARALLPTTDANSRRRLTALFATPEDVNRANRAKFQALEAAAPGQPQEGLTGVRAPKFVASGGLWWLLLVLVLSLRFWPSDAALTGGALVPLGTDWVELFNRAGSSWQLLAGGFAAPSDPFNWVLLALGSVTAWQPSLAIGGFMFLAKGIAFVGAWRALTLVSHRPAALTLGALGFAFWPALNEAQLEGRLGSVVAIALLPFFVYTLSRLLRIGQSTQVNTAAWTWLATSALLAAAISAGAPSLTPVVAALILLLGIYRWRRLGYLIWLPVPIAVLWLPLAFYLTVGLQHPAGLLQDPLVPLWSRAYEPWQLLLGGAAGLDFWLAGPVVIALLALFAPLTRRALPALWLWLVVLVAVIAGWLFNQIDFVNNSPLGTAGDFNAGSPLAFAGLAGLVLAMLAAMSLDSLFGSGRKIWIGLTAVTAVAAAGLLAATFVLAESPLKYTDGRQVPAVVAASRHTGVQLLLIGASPASDSSYRLSVIPAGGLNLQDLSVAERLALPTLTNGTSAAAERAMLVTELASNMISANGADLMTTTKKLNLGYVLVPADETSAELVGALDSVAELEPVGVTEFGRLWRVRSADFSTTAASYPLWSLTKTVQFGTLVLFALLALPTRRLGRSSASVSDIDGIDDLSDAFSDQEQS